jgi:hypothetical protein
MRSTLRRDLPIPPTVFHGFEGSQQSHPVLQKADAMNGRYQILKAPGAQVHGLADPRMAGQHCVGVSD